MTKDAYDEFVAPLKAKYPNDEFLIVRFGDHQPTISQKLIEPGIAPDELGKRLIMAHDPRYFATYYAIDGINYRPKNLASALPTLDAAYLPIVVQEAAGVPLDPSFAEQKRDHAPLRRRVLRLPRRRRGAPLQPAADRMPG